MRALKRITNVLMIIVTICIFCFTSTRICSIRIAPDITVNSVSINSTKDQIIINYTLQDDFYSDASSGRFLHIGFEYPAEYRGAFENQYVSINQKAGTYTALLPYTRGLCSNISIMAHYQAAWGRGVDEYVYMGSCFISHNS